MTLPETMRALVLSSPSNASLQTIPLPTPHPGALLVKITATLVQSNTREIFSSASPAYTLPHPVVPGTNAIGRVAALSPDTTSLQPGDLVMLDSFIRARDDPWKVQFLWGAADGASPASKHLYRSSWRNACFAEYALAPLENTHLLDDKRLLGNPRDGGLGLSAQELLYLASSAIVYGGLRGISLRPGERIVVTPATGASSGAAVAVAHAMGASVIAASRSATKLAALKACFPASAGRRGVETVVMTGEVEADAAALRAFGPVDAAIDVSPPEATGSTYIRSAVMAVRPYGRVSLMGGRGDDSLPFPWVTILANNLTIRGQFMYERKDVKELISMAEAGLLRLGRAAGHDVDEYQLEEWDEAVDVARKRTGHGKITCIVP